jgi:hypothetical protein
MIKLGIKMFDISDLERKLSVNIDLKRGVERVLDPIVSRMTERASALISRERPNSKSLSQVDSVVRVEGDSVVAVISFSDKPYTLSQLQLSKSQPLKTVIKGAIIPTEKYEGVKPSEFISRNKSKSFPLTSKRGNELIALADSGGGRSRPTLFAKESRQADKVSGDYNFTIAYVKPKQAVINKVPVASVLEFTQADIDIMKNEIIKMIADNLGGTRV